MRLTGLEIGLLRGQLGLDEVFSVDPDPIRTGALTGGGRDPRALSTA